MIRELQEWNCGNHYSFPNKKISKYEQIDWDIEVHTIAVLFELTKVNIFESVNSLSGFTLFLISK